jgi:hypothetical protein
MTTNTGTIQFGTSTGTDQTYEILTASSSSDLKITATGKLTLKAPENINIDGSINLYDGSQKYGTFTSDSNGDLTIQSGSGSTENINLNASQHINIGLNTTTSTTTYCYLAQDTNPINGLNGVSINSYDSIDGTNNPNSNVTINAGSTGGNIYLNGNGTVNLLNGTTQYGAFTSNTLAGSGTTSDLSITSGNTTDHSGNIFLNALKKSGTAGATDIAIGIGIGTQGNNLGIFIDDTGLLHLESKNGYKISGNDDVELQSTDDNVTIDASKNITLAPGDDGIIFRGNNNGGLVGSFTYNANNFYINADKNLYLNSSTNSINLQNDGITFGSFTSEGSNNLKITPGSGNTVNIDGSLSVTGSISGSISGSNITGNIDVGISNISGNSISAIGDISTNGKISAGSASISSGGLSVGGDISASTGSIDGSPIVTASSLSNTLGDYVTTSNLTLTLGDYATTNSVTSSISSSINSTVGSAYSPLGSYVVGNPGIFSSYTMIGKTSFNLPTHGLYLLFVCWSSTQNGNNNTYPAAWMITWFPPYNGTNIVPQYVEVFGHSSSTSGNSLVSVSVDNGGVVQLSAPSSIPGCIGDGSGLAILVYLGNNTNTRGP